MKEILSKVDIVSTQKFYLSQNFIEDDCNCDTCIYFQNQFINKQLEIFKLLTNVGVDLRKDLSSELTGMYGVLNNGFSFIVSVLIN